MAYGNKATGEGSQKASHSIDQGWNQQLQRKNTKTTHLAPQLAILENIHNLKILKIKNNSYL